MYITLLSQWSSPQSTTHIKSVRSKTDARSNDQSFLLHHSARRDKNLPLLKALSFTFLLLLLLPLLLLLLLSPMEKKKKWLLPLAVAATMLLTSLLIFMSFSSSPLATSSLFSSSSSRPPPPHNPVFVESKLSISPPSSNPLPRLAYLISGSVGDGANLRRTLKALYHPLNCYVLHLDLESSPAERMELAEFVKNEPTFARFGNVRVVVRANLVTYRGPSMVANTLHAAAILLREVGDWDWFINLSASDYPLVTQDGIQF